MGKQKSFLRQWLASESIASDSIASDAAASKSASTADQTSGEAGAGADKPGQPALREVLGAINRIVREGGTARAGAPAAAPHEPPAPQKIPIVAKLTIPLGEAQRDNLLVMSLLGLDVVLGATFGLIGYFGLESASIAMAGAVVVLVGIVAMALYQRFGRER